jgi:UDP-GlcNAc3NAcA epimerase
MSDIFFDEMEIPKPDIFLNINQLSHGAMTGRMIEGIEKVILAENPDAVLLYGDTNSTLAGALAAVKLHIPVAHVEAGLRSFNRRMPEEHNRVLSDHVSTFLFCPTANAVENLRREGLSDYPNGRDCGKTRPRVVMVGDVMYDAALFYAEKAKVRARISRRLLEEFSASRHFLAVTLHREENTDSPERLGSILDALVRISQDMEIVWPVHPRTARKIKAHGLSIGDGSRIHVIEPVGYFDMIELLRNCSLVMTDSGGLQKEAYFFGKPCVTLRDETEWVELAEHGFNRVAGTDPKKICEAFSEMMHKKLDFSVRLYGKGDAGKRIVSVIGEHLKGVSSSQPDALRNPGRL